MSPISPLYLGQRAAVTHLTSLTRPSQARRRPAPPRPRSPGLQRPDTHQLVHPLHHAGHRGDQLVVLHISTVTPAERQRLPKDSPKPRHPAAAASPPALPAPHVSRVRGDGVPRCHQVLLAAPERAGIQGRADRRQPHGDRRHLGAAARAFRPPCWLLARARLRARAAPS